MTTYKQIFRYLIIVLIILVPFYILVEIYESNYKEKSFKKPNSYQKNSPIKKPLKTTSVKLRLIVMADSRGSDHGINTSVIKKIMGQIKKLSPQPEFAILPGDLVGGGKSYQTVKGQLAYFKQLVTRYYPEEFFYPGIGNHEVNVIGPGGEKAFSEVFGKYKANLLKGYYRSVYYFDKGNTRFFMLNSNHPGSLGLINDQQLGWLKKNIKSVMKHNLYFFHEPAYPTGPHVGNSLDSHPLARDKLWQVIDQSNSPMIFCGHEHFYTRRHIDSAFNQNIQGFNFRYTKSIYQVTVGSFGAPLYSKFSKPKNVDIPPIAEYHFAVVEIVGNRIEVTVYNLNGKVIDSFKQVS